MQHARALAKVLALALTIATGWMNGAAQVAASEARVPLHALLDRVLHDTVRDERIDYAAIRGERLEILDAYLGVMADVHPAALGRSDRLAFYINLYNATMVRAIVRRYQPGYSTAAHEFAVFQEPLVRLEGERISLDHLEHKIIRERFKDPRVHVALVCGARSCPPLLPRAYRGEDLDAVLEANMRRFINDPERNRIDHARRRLELSRIFDWFAEDFGGAEAVAGYVNRYTEADVSGYEVTFLEYSWELNDTSATAGR